MNKETTITRGQLFLLIMKFEIGVDILSLLIGYIFCQKAVGGSLFSLEVS
ncbi:hypothetical protein Q0F98_37630 [Paenibacillus amylolyticus]|nr:hypothetical protein Q0F98_37630 [Paenibacillus amylolyticus]